MFITQCFLNFLEKMSDEAEASLEFNQPDSNHLEENLQVISKDFRQSKEYLPTSEGVGLGFGLKLELLN